MGFGKTVDIVKNMRIKPERVGLDGFTVTMRDGSELAPHEGQSVWLLPYGATAPDIISSGAKLQAAMSFDAAGEVEDVDLDALGEAIPRMAAHCAAEIVKHDITDAFGDPYPQFYQNPGALEALPSALLWHLYGIVRGTEDAGKEPPDSDA